MRSLRDCAPGAQMMRKLSLFLALAISARGAEPDIGLADFEGPDYGGWITRGEAFGTAPARGTLPNQQTVSGFVGKGLVNTFLGGDAATGTLMSPEFMVSRRFVTLLVGGGGFAGKTCVNLRVGGQVVRTATGPNTEPGGSEELSPHSWDVSEFAGRMAQIEIVDQATGGWGHINVDQIVLTDAKPPVELLNATREITCDRRYLHLPVKTGARKRRVAVSVEGAVVREFEIELADAEPDFFTFLDLTPFAGKTATVAVDRLAADSRAFQALEVSDALQGAEQLYREPLRGQFHFSSRRGWLNDPNGLVHDGREYHLFYQHNPYGWAWGNMHWGHAVSDDLVRWKELPIALYPRKFGDWAFSGSAVIDRENTSGWKRGDGEVMVAAYTSTGRGECIVFSHDRGRTWQEYEGNPVVRHEGRDPRLVWHAPTRRWVMALYSEAEKKRWITFHTSPDLKTWTYESRIEGFYECPDLFALPVDGDGDKAKWVLTGASSEYMVGAFDGRTFTPETPKLPGHRGRGFYAAQTFSNDPHGRIVQIGWFQTPTPGMPFNQSMTIALELGLRSTADGARLTWQPVRELESLRGRRLASISGPLSEGRNPLENVRGELLEIRAEIDPGNATEFGLNVRGASILYDARKQELSLNNHKAPAPLRAGMQRLIIYVDRTGLEVFASDGLTYMPIPVNLKNEDRGIEAFARGGTARIEALEVHELRSIWP